MLTVALQLALGAVQARPAAPGANDRHSPSCTEPVAQIVWWSDSRFGYVDPSLKQLRQNLKGKWLLIVGDSSLRMTYHLLRGHVVFGWQQWPTTLDNHGPRNWSAMHDCELGHGQWVNRSRDGQVRLEGTVKCLEHVYLGQGILLTFVWLDLFDVDQLEPLVSFARDMAYGAPDGIAVTMGAYHSGMRAHLEEFATRFKAVLDRLQVLFPHTPQRAAAGLPQCGAKTTHDTLMNAVIRNTSTLLNWKYLDRQAVTARPCSVCPCSVSSDCTLGRYHPSGATLNILTKLLLLTVGFGDRRQPRNSTLGDPMDGA